jgi:hypothetical protein
MKAFPMGSRLNQKYIEQLVTSFLRNSSQLKPLFFQSSW